jgi:hypothetical protein
MRGLLSKNKEKLTFCKSLLFKSKTMTITQERKPNSLISKRISYSSIL